VFALARENPLALGRRRQRIGCGVSLWTAATQPRGGGCCSPPRIRLSSAALLETRAQQLSTSVGLRLPAQRAKGCGQA
jgi:hypothetical protein